MIILAVYLLSIFVVGYFGMKVAVYNQTVYVSEVAIYQVVVDGDEVEIKTDENGDKYCTVSYYEPREGESFVVWLYWRVNPTDASNTNVHFFCDQKDFVKLDETKGTLTFSRPGTITVYVEANDGSKKADKITVRAKKLG